MIHLDLFYETLPEFPLLCLIELKLDFAIRIHRHFGDTSPRHAARADYQYIAHCQSPVCLFVICISVDAVAIGGHQYFSVFGFQSAL